MVRHLIQKAFGRAAVLKNAGYCPTCDSDVVFVARDPWLRDSYRCRSCGSIPRERALMQTIEERFPRWRELTIHETSPGNRGASVKLANECPAYFSTQFFPDRAPGSIVDGVRCENLEALTFEDESVDLHISQDVMEHLLRPERAFREVARTLKPGGAHVFTVPLVNKFNPSRVRARWGEDGEVLFLHEPQYHGNPVSEDGALVTVDWGYDICEQIFDACGLFTQMIYIDDLSKGIRAELNEVLVTYKP